MTPSEERHFRNEACAWMEAIGLDPAIIGAYRDLPDGYWLLKGGALGATRADAVAAVAADAVAADAFDSARADAEARDAAADAARDATATAYATGATPPVDAARAVAWTNSRIIWNCAYVAYFRNGLDMMLEIME